jgi:hypothetical protein
MFDTCDATKSVSSPAELRAAQRVRRLARMADLGLSLGEKLHRQAELAAVHSETDAVPDNLPHSKRLDGIGRAFAQVSRAVSLSTALEDRIDNGLPALPDEALAAREREAKAKRVEVEKAVVRTIEADPPFQSRRRMVDLRIRLDRLLDAELADLHRFLGQPFHQIEVRLRRDLGLEPEDDAAADRDPPPNAAACGGGGPRSGGGGLRTPPDNRRSFYAAERRKTGDEQAAAPSPLHRRSAAPLPRPLPRSVEEKGARAPP